MFFNVKYILNTIKHITYEDWDAANICVASELKTLFGPAAIALNAAINIT